MIRTTRINRTTGMIVLALLAGLAVPAVANAYCSSYGIMCYRTWTPEERPGILSRLRAADGDYMGSIFLPEGNCSTLNLGINCRPCEPTQAADWSQACNAQLSECLGQCFAQPE